MSEHLQWTGKPKIAYENEADAEQHRLELSAARGVYFSAYMCRCGKWHIGRIPRPRYDWREEMLVGKLIQALKNTINPPPKSNTRSRK